MILQIGNFLRLRKRGAWSIHIYKSTCYGVKGSDWENLLTESCESGNPQNLIWVMPAKGSRKTKRENQKWRLLGVTFFRFCSLPLNRFHLCSPPLLLLSFWLQDTVFSAVVEQERFIFFWCAWRTIRKERARPSWQGEGEKGLPELESHWVVLASLRTWDSFGQ